MQKAIFVKIKEAICNSMECYPVSDNAIGIYTPFLDWMGEHMEIFVTSEGDITDGDGTLNQIKALNTYDDFLKWLDRENYLENYNINPKGGSLDLHYFETDEGILRYIQGIARLPGFFESKPLGEKQEQFPTYVKRVALDALINEYPERPKEGVVDWASKMTKPRFFKVKNYSIHSDMSPVDENKLVEIIGFQGSEDSEQKKHIREKLFNPLLWGLTNPNVETIAVTYNLSDYSREAQELLCDQAEVIELMKPKAKVQLAKKLAEA